MLFRKVAPFFPVVFLFVSGCGSRGEEVQETSGIRKFPVMTLQESDVTVSSDYPARIEGKVNVAIRAQAEGYIEKIFVEEGAFVRTGQPLFKIADAPYVQQLHTARAGLAAAEAALRTAALEVEKFTELSSSRVTSDFQLRSAKAAYASAEANVALQKAAVEAARINLDFTLVKAPVSGFIGRIPKRVGNLAGRTDDQPLTTLSDIHEVYAYFSMTEKDFLGFNRQYPDKTMPAILGALPEVTLQLADGNSYGLPGKIQMVDGQFDSQTGAISLRAMFRNPRFLLRSGNTGRIVLPNPVRRALLVPARATVDIQDKIFAFRVNDKNVTERVTLTISGKSGDHYIVQDGLKPGDRIIAREAALVEEGERITPRL